ncbi:MAG: MBL fold metallo-hydrolase [Bdellovibrionia bacterium]
MKKKAQIQVIGSGEAFSASEGNTSYLFQGAGYPTILFDCGYQVPERLWKEDSQGDIAVICITHLHADHVFGIAPLLCRYLEEGRRDPLKIVGGRGTETYVRRLIEMGYPGILSAFAFKLEFLEISETKGIDFKSFRMTVAKTKHSVRNYTYRVDFRDPKIRSFAVSGDGQMTAETCELVNNVGVLLQEVYSLKETTPVHMALSRFEKWATNSQVGILGVAHHSRKEVSLIRRRVEALKKKDARWMSVTPETTISLS